MKRLLFFLVAAGIVLGMALSSFGADGAKPLIIDVRTEAEWNEGHLEGAILIPHIVIGEKIRTVSENKLVRIYVYCGTGKRSQIAKETLEKLGYKDVVNLGTLEDAAKTMKQKM